ncbi:MAG: methionine--tRNA ligase subunit beta [Candidatus Lokiarchaeota archaeon]|nr:methionine--tRNA ligase subunit beta [Candidatus Lokiarchaeota archaeon]
MIKMKKSQKELVSIDDFTKIDIRIGKIKEVEIVPNSNKLFKMVIDIKEKELQCVAGLRDYYTADKLKNKLVPLIINLEPAKIRGVKSEGMLLAAQDKNKVKILTPEEDVEVGAIVR